MKLIEGAKKAWGNKTFRRAAIGLGAIGAIGLASKLLFSGQDDEEIEATPEIEIDDDSTEETTEYEEE